MQSNPKKKKQLLHPKHFQSTDLDSPNVVASVGLSNWKLNTMRQVFFAFSGLSSNWAFQLDKKRFHFEIFQLQTYILIRFCWLTKRKRHVDELQNKIWSLELFILLCRLLLSCFFSVVKLSLSFSWLYVELNPNEWLNHNFYT